MATRRDEQAQSLDVNQEGNAQERVLEDNQVNEKSNLGKMQEQLEAKLVELPLKEQKDELKKDNDESLQAVASRSGVDETNEKNSHNVREVYNYKKK